MFYQTRNIAEHCPALIAIEVLKCSGALIGKGRIVQNSGGQVLMMLADGFEPAPKDILGAFNFDADGYFNQAVWINGRALEWHPCGLAVFDTVNQCGALAFVVRNKNFESAMRTGHVPARFIAWTDGTPAQPGEKLCCKECGRDFGDVVLE